MLAAAASQRPSEYDEELAEVFAGLEQYYDPQRSAYNAWVSFPGNVDSYSDDNAWLVMVFCEATKATGERRYADRAAELMEGYIRHEWRDDDGPLGMRCGFKPDGPRHQNMRAAIRASTAAVAAMHLADLGYTLEQNLARAAIWAGRGIVTRPNGTPPIITATSAAHLTDFTSGTCGSGVSTGPKLSAVSVGVERWLRRRGTAVRSGSGRAIT